MNKEFKGTKREWSIRNVYIEKSWVNITSDKGIIARTFYGNLEPIITKEEAIANAQLISAAPDLLEALMNIENDNGNIPESIWQMRNKAINKALGND